MNTKREKEQDKWILNKVDKIKISGYKKEKA